MPFRPQIRRGKRAFAALWGTELRLSVRQRYYENRGETVLKVKVPPVRIENSLSPLYREGYRLFYSRRDFSDSLGGAQFCALPQTTPI